MIRKNIRLMYLKDGCYAVGYEMGHSCCGEKKRDFTILKKLYSSIDARAYAAALIDGVNLASYFAGKESYEPINPDEVRVCQSFIDATKEKGEMFNMEKSSKNYVCHVNDCLNNDNCGGCLNASQFVTIALYDGAAVCPNYESVRGLDDGKAALAAGLLHEIQVAVEKIDGEPLEEELSAMELCTDSDFVCFMCRPDGKYLQDFACDERVSALVDAYNVLVYGKPNHCKPV